ncbi:TRAP transporter small permease subunit [Parasalinivibrio latis]|uniref:TRAP transporter small permease subunit n=1 Tax=Parasalinivibrio latis TaxID=2952610 RepID=UPI0030DEF37D
MHPDDLDFALNPEAVASRGQEKQVKNLPDTRLSRALDNLVLAVNNRVAWLWALLMAIIILNVVMRYALGEGRVEFEELQWHLYSIGWLIGLSYCYIADEHVRVDLFYERFSLKARCWIELLGTLFLLLPFAVVVIYYTGPFIAYSFELGEVSAAPGGLPYRWLIKSVLLLGFVFLMLAVIARLSRVIAYLLNPKTVQPTVSEGAPDGN